MFSELQARPNCVSAGPPGLKPTAGSVLAAYSVYIFMVKVTRECLNTGSKSL